MVNSSYWFPLSCSFFGKIVLCMHFSLEYFILPYSFIKSWVVLGKNAKVKTKAAASNLDFDEQCKHCEKVIFSVFRFECIIWLLKFQKVE